MIQYIAMASTRIKRKKFLIHYTVGLSDASQLIETIIQLTYFRVRLETESTVTLASAASKLWREGIDNLVGQRQSLLTQSSLCRQLHVWKFRSIRNITALGKHCIVDVKSISTRGRGGYWSPRPRSYSV